MSRLPARPRTVRRCLVSVAALLLALALPGPAAIGGAEGDAPVTTCPAGYEPVREFKLTA